jgi:hypothetical protein
MRQEGLGGANMRQEGLGGARRGLQCGRLELSRVSLAASWLFWSVKLAAFDVEHLVTLIS